MNISIKYFNKEQSTTEVEETIKRLSTNKHVQGVMIVNEDGQTIKSTFDVNLSKKYSDLITKLIEQAKTCVKDMDESNDLTFLRVRTKKHELMVAPENEYYLIVLQNPEKS
ncbi:9777_t:CDS:2 [Entrophospora sp. SA101]|nr:9777_t:CDS:2 [Entrophospora sp. SA101]